LNISSQIELPGVLETTGNCEPDVEIIFKKTISPISRVETDSSNFIVDNEDIYVFWENIGKVKISTGNNIKVEYNDKNLIIPFLLGPVMALLLHQRGLLVLHGSAVKIKDEAIAFIGYRGIGKSTTAINLCKKGYPLITDDILAISFDENGKPYIYPGYHHVRLSEDSYNHIKDETNILTPIRTIVGKVFCDASHGFSQEPLMLNRVYSLERGNQTEIFTLNSKKTLMDLIIHSVANRIFQVNDQAKNLTQCANLINNVPIRRLEINHSFKDISKLINLIENDLFE
jgi:hypothetical protein